MEVKLTATAVFFFNVISLKKFFVKKFKKCKLSEHKGARAKNYLVS